MAEHSGYPAILLIAFVLDALAGDPRWLPHPVVWMGRAISFFEKKFRAAFTNLFLSGLVFALFLIAVVWVVSLGVVKLALAVHPVVGIIVQGVLLFYCFSVKSLVTAAHDVAIPLMAGDLPEARNKVAMIVGRETQTLDREAVTRAAIETVAENFVDGFLSPLFFFLLLGVPGALAYKMINTLDSMVGYKNDAYILFGRASARIDDMANYIPARFSMFVISGAAFILSPKRGVTALKTAFEEARNHKSPNAGFPEAAFAGALAMRMGGPNVYHGQMVDKPYIGARFPDPSVSKIRMACELMMLSALVAVVVALAVIFLIGWAV
ncbi:adenosylcobinamide-phosphate synthase CbiB [Desulfospira joergensenii]|uniref:adenosylcobinamide-phosphate synthase CbiB n=1 Tax=Desulfospira joergensenii TaxID=53329 RepID=UPI0003B7A91F|nr:adenosylcobinamide-phosphate synthase CbiB [Desulfospira joergensenii]